MTDASTTARPRGLGGLGVYGERRVFVMLLLGFADDVLDVPWRVRLFFFRLS